jgi:hypothetical protein
MAEPSRICSVPNCGRPLRARGWCATHYFRWSKWGDVDAGRPIMKDRDKVAEFWQNVDKRGADDCWPWVGVVDPCGYGRFSAGGRSGLAHRWSYAQAYGPIPNGQPLDHTCHHNRDPQCPRGRACLHRRCVNPRHLEPVSLEENSYRAYGSSAERCPAGHPRTPENTLTDNKGNRVCHPCKKRNARAYLQRKRDESASL